MSAYSWNKASENQGIGMLQDLRTESQQGVNMSPPNWL